jgi:hypothetical protein
MLLNQMHTKVEIKRQSAQPENLKESSMKKEI